MLKKIADPLLTWYDSGHRDLPWRQNKDPYRIWVSEIMLQQTRVEAVIPYYERFMERFPDVGALAEAKEETLLKYWEGLGYYSRVRNMHKAAVTLMQDYDGRMPHTWEELQKLSGIGSYTAGAIASIAFGQPVPAVDGNVLRILSRLRMDEEYITLPAVKKRVESELSKIMPPKRPGDFNQAMMELGAMVCIPNGIPKCENCPWSKLCEAHKNGCVTEYPRREEKKKRSIEHKTVLLLKEGSQIAIEKRPAKGLLAGMYQFPMREGHLSEKELIVDLEAQGMIPIRIERLPEATHIFSHKEWHMIGYAVRVDELERRKPLGGLLFVEPGETKERYPIPSAFSAYAKFMNMKLGAGRFERVES